MAGRRIDREKAKAKFLEVLRAGNTIVASAGYAGVDPDTIRNWEARDSAFSAAIKEAEAAAEVRNVTIIQKAAQDGTWTAAAWWLERRRHENWKRRQQIEERMDDEQLNALIEIELAKLAGGRAPADAGDAETAE